MATSAKLRSHLAGKRPALDIGRKGRRWRVGMSTRVWRLLLTATFFLLIFGAAVQLPEFSHFVEKVQSLYPSLSLYKWRCALDINVETLLVPEEQTVSFC